MGIEVKFTSAVQNDETDSELFIKSLTNTIFIVVRDKQSKNQSGTSIFLDKYTASKLAK
jgi:hypothetical protein